MQLIDILKFIVSVKLYSKGYWLLVVSTLKLTGYVCTVWYHSGDHQCDNVTLLTICTLHFTAAGSTEHKSVQVGHTTKQQGVYTTVC